ncbi:MAG: hypothetical protein LBR08_07495 [Bacteroidales bacterium]|nr:hypothetical protein [Bacteroidales bacterium]
MQYIAATAFFSEGYSGSLYLYGANIVAVRYAEILSGYPETRWEGEMPITRPLLDSTINAVRGRASVRTPAVTETDGL